MASLYDCASIVREEVEDGMAWILLWKTGRAWNVDVIHPEAESYETYTMTLTESELEFVKAVIAADADAILVNGYYSNLGVWDGSVSSRCLEHRLRWQYFDCKPLVINWTFDVLTHSPATSLEAHVDSEVLSSVPDRASSIGFRRSISPDAPSLADLTADLNGIPVWSDYLIAVLTKMRHCSEDYEYADGTGAVYSHLFGWSLAIDAGDNIRWVNLDKDELGPVVFHDEELAQFFLDDKGLDDPIFSHLAADIPSPVASVSSLHQDCSRLPYVRHRCLDAV